MNLRVKDVADQLNISEKTVYKWLRDGLLPARRIGKTWIITEEALRSVSTPASLRPVSYTHLTLPTILLV